MNRTHFKTNRLLFSHFSCSLISAAFYLCTHISYAIPLDFSLFLMIECLRESKKNLHKWQMSVDDDIETIEDDATQFMPTSYLHFICRQILCRFSGCFFYSRAILMTVILNVNGSCMTLYRSSDVSIAMLFRSNTHYSQIIICANKIMDKILALIRLNCSTKHRSAHNRALQIM